MSSYLGPSIKYRLYLGAGVLVVGAAAIGAVLALRAVHPPEEGTAASHKRHVIVGMVRNLKNVEEKAFKLLLASKSWAIDTEARQRLGALAVLKKVGKEKDGWLAVFVKDYGRTPSREAELVSAGIEKLEHLFEGAVELAEKPEPAILSEVEGQRLLFKGQLNSVAWWGYIYMVAHQGFGYWLCVAAPDKDGADELFANDLQGTDRGFVFYTDRESWRARPPKMESFTSAGRAVTITVPEGVFMKHVAKDQDEHGELYLFARYQKEQDNRKNADVLVLVLPKEADLKEAMTAAKKYLEDKKKEESNDYRIGNAADGQSELGVSAAVGNRPGRITECMLLRGEAPARFWIIAVVNEADRAYVFRCDSSWDNRQIWREDFLALLHSVRFR